MKWNEKANESNTQAKKEEDRKKVQEAGIIKYSTEILIRNWLEVGGLERWKGQQRLSCKTSISPSHTHTPPLLPLYFVLSASPPVLLLLPLCSTNSFSLSHSTPASLSHFLVIINNLWKTFQRVQPCRRSCPSKWNIITHHPPCVLRVQLVQQEISVIRQIEESPRNYCLISQTFVKLVSGDW